MDSVDYKQLVLLRSGSMLIPMNTLDVLISTSSEPSSLPQNQHLWKDHGSNRQFIQQNRNEMATRHLQTARISKTYIIQTPEDRLLHLDKHLRRSVLF